MAFLKSSDGSDKFTRAERNTKQGMQLKKIWENIRIQSLRRKCQTSIFLLMYFSVDHRNFKKQILLMNFLETVVPPVCSFLALFSITWNLSVIRFALSACTVCGCMKKEGHERKGYATSETRSQSQICKLACSFKTISCHCNLFTEGWLSGAANLFPSNRFPNPRAFIIAILKKKSWENIHLNFCKQI